MSSSPGRRTLKGAQAAIHSTLVAEGSEFL